MSVPQNISKTLQAIFLFSLFLLAIGCGMPDKSAVKTSFLQEHPNYRVIDIHVDEGDFDSVYFHIVYRKPEEEKIYGDMWLYLRNKDREMKVFQKWTLADAVNHSSMKGINNNH